MPYTSVFVSDYNASPPFDDGSTGVSNQITWAGIKTKLGDPLKTAIEAINSGVSTACDTLDAAIATEESSITTQDGLITSDQSGLSAPAATELFFVQTNAPTGWTKITTYNDRALRLVTGTPSTGGSTAFTSVLASRTIAAANLPVHSHTFSNTGNSLTFARSTWSTGVNNNTVSNRDAGGSTVMDDHGTTDSTISATISFSGTTTSAGSGTALDFAVQYVDVILASKD